LAPIKKNRSASGSLQTPQGQGIPSIPKFLHERGGNDEEEKVAEVGSEGGGELVKVREKCEISEMGCPLRGALAKRK
jgi:hypothetical protein